jgi:Carboxypeptidase regulatory-like domain
MIRWSTVIVLVAVVATGCQGGSASPSPTSPSSASTQLSPVTFRGVVRDLLQRPVRDARIEVTEGPSSGLAVSTDALGQFSFTATTSSDRVALTVSKDGYDTATVRLRADQAVILLRDSAVANLEGRATLAFTADASCTQLPASLRTRSYTAVVMPSTGPSPATFVGELNGADFYQGYDKMSLTAARDAVRFNIFSWDAFKWWLEDQPIIERVTPTSHFSVSGTASAAVSTGQATITTALDGTFSFCAESKAGAQPPWPPTCAVPLVECTSAHHLLTMNRR